MWWSLESRSTQQLGNKIGGRTERTRISRKIELGSPRTARSFFVSFQAWLRRVDPDTCGTKLVRSQVLPRAEEHASEHRTGLGGWYPQVNGDCKIVVWTSRWFSSKNRKDEWGWVCAKGDKPALIIATLEATLFSPRSLFWRRAEQHYYEGDGRPVMAGQCRERSSPRRPSSCSCQSSMKKMGLRTVVQWARKKAAGRRTHWLMETVHNPTQPCGSRSRHRRSSATLCRQHLTQDVHASAPRSGEISLSAGKRNKQR